MLLVLCLNTGVQRVKEMAELVLGSGFQLTAVSTWRNTWPPTPSEQALQGLGFYYLIARVPNGQSFRPFLIPFQCDKYIEMTPAEARDAGKHEKPNKGHLVEQAETHILV